jgi:Recombinase/Resolvase, N terminal domain/Recombinase zinc beta ribbon domain
MSAFRKTGTHLNVIRRDFERKGVRVVFRKIPGELNPTQNLMINILGSFAEFEREMIADRTRRGVRFKVEVRKLYLGCRSAYGYRYTTKTKSTEGAGKLEVWPEEAAVVRKIYDWVDKESLSAHQVVTRLNRLQIPARKLGVWGKSSVLRVLRNEMYAGIWHYNKHYSCEPMGGHTKPTYLKVSKSSRRLRSRADWIPVPLSNDLGIVPRDQWERVQGRITGNISWSPRNSRHDYLLRGLVTCAGCNARFVGDPGYRKYSYRCHKRCKQVPMIGEERLNDAVWEALKKAIMSPEVIVRQATKYYEERRKLNETVNVEKQKASVVRAQLEAEEQRILEAYRQGVLTPAQLGSQLEMLNARRNMLHTYPNESADEQFGDDASHVTDLVGVYESRSREALACKHQVYQAISEVNRAFEQVIACLEALSEFPFFRRDCVKANQVVVEEIRALANHELLEILSQREFGNMAYYERLRLKWQNQFKDPGDASRAQARQRAATSIMLLREKQRLEELYSELMSIGSDAGQEKGNFQEASRRVA